MRTYIITGAPGIGKTTLLRHLLNRLPEKGAALDSDQLGLTNPMNWNCSAHERFVVKNITDFAANANEWGAGHLVVSHILNNDADAETLCCNLERVSSSVSLIALVADDEVLVARNEERDKNVTKNQEYCRDMVQKNMTIRRLSNAKIIDTTGMNVSETVETLLGCMQGN